MRYIIKIGFIWIGFISSYAISEEKDKTATIFCNLIEKSSSQQAQLFLSIIEKYYSLSLPYDTSLEQNEILPKIVNTIAHNDATILYDKLNNTLLKLLIIIMSYHNKEEFLQAEQAIEKCVNCLAIAAHKKRTLEDENILNNDLWAYCYAYFELLLDPVRLGLSSVVLQQQVETFIKTTTTEIIKSVAFSSEYIELSKHYIIESVRRSLKDLLLSKASLTIDTQLYNLMQNKVIPFQSNTQTLRQDAYQRFEQALQARLDNNISVTDILLDNAVFAEKLILEAFSSLSN